MVEPSERPGPPGGKRDLNRRRRLEDLREAGLCLFLAKGLDNITIDDIAREGGTAKGNFYRYFDDKTALVDSIVASLRSQVLEAMGGCEERLLAASDRRDLFTAYQELGDRLGIAFLQDPRVVLLFLQENRGPAVGARAPLRDLADQLVDAAVRLTQVACDHGLLRVEDPRVSALAVVGAVERLALAVLQGRLDDNPAQISKMLVSLVLEGIRA